MTEIGIVLIIAALVLAVIAFLLGRVGSATREIVSEAGPRPEAEPVRPRPSVAEFHVRGGEAQVCFDVPLPGGGPEEIDEVLRDVLVHEAVEVVREKRHSLPIGEVTRVVALARRDGSFAEVGSVTLSEPGVLPPPAADSPLAHLGRLGVDPLEQQFVGASVDEAPRIDASEVRERELGPVGAELRLPRAVEVGLRAQGHDPRRLTAGELVLGLLELVGYHVTPGPKKDTYLADRPGSRTFVRVVPHRAGGYPEVEAGAIEAFVVDFVSSGAERGLLVSDKYGPFEIYQRERRDPRVRFVTRERLQNFIDAMALG